VWARHFDLGVNYTARMNRRGYILVECSELPPENARLIAPDGKMTTTSISSPLIHGINLYNFCQKQTDEFYYCAKEEGQSTMLCRFNPVEDTHTKLFPLSALGQDVQRLNNGTYIKDELGEGLIVDVTTRFKSVHIIRIDLHTFRKVWDRSVKHEVCAILPMEGINAVAFAQPEGHLGILSCTNGEQLYREQVRASGVVTPITSLATKGPELAVGTIDGRVFLYQVSSLSSCPPSSSMSSCFSNSSISPLQSSSIESYVCARHMMIPSLIFISSLLLLLAVFSV
jgi:hypothetical protein